MAGGAPASDRRSICWLLPLQFLFSPRFHKERVFLASIRCEGCDSRQPLAIPTESRTTSRKQIQRGTGLGNTAVDYLSSRFRVATSSKIDLKMHIQSKTNFLS